MTPLGNPGNPAPGSDHDIPPALPMPEPGADAQLPGVQGVAARIAALERRVAELERNEVDFDAMVEAVKDRMTIG